MAKNVLITPASGLVEFYETAGNLEASIQLDNSNNLVITGNVTLGDAGGDVYIGDGVSPANVIFEQGGAIYGLATKTLTLGIAGSFLSLAANITSGANITGNVQGGNLITSGLITATGNVSGGNLNVTGNIVDTGALSIITGSNGNIALAPNGTGIVTVSSALNVTGNVQGGNITASANVSSGNILTTGTVSATGNVSGNYFIGNGSQLTGISTSSNANLAILTRDDGVVYFPITSGFLILLTRTGNISIPLAA